MIDHIKLAEKCGIGWQLTSESPQKIFVMRDEELQAYTNAILEYAAVRCDRCSLGENRFDFQRAANQRAEECAEAIRQEKV